MQCHNFPELPAVSVNLSLAYLKMLSVFMSGFFYPLFVDPVTDIQLADPRTDFQLLHHSDPTCVLLIKS
jgi:hypothetical protein